MFERISVDPTIHFGKPCVKGTRIKVQDVLELVNAGVSFDELDAHYPDFVSCRHICVEDLGDGIRPRAMPPKQPARP